MGTEELGIEKIKNALKAVIDLVENVDMAYEDGELTLAEILSAAVGVIPDGIQVFQNRKEIVAEYQDLSVAEKSELKLFVAAELDIRNDVAEVIAESAFEFLLALDTLVGAIREAKAIKDSEKEEEE